jgi:hypothetical protein
VVKATSINCAESFGTGYGCYFKSAYHKKGVSFGIYYPEGCLEHHQYSLAVAPRYAGNNQ